VQCDSCFWWFHIECSDSGIPLSQLDSTLFLCNLCRYREEHISDPSTSHGQLEAAKDSISDPASSHGQKDTSNKLGSDAFILVKRTGRHKVCRGCGVIREKLACPHDYLLAHREAYTYFDKKTETNKVHFGNRFYHVNMACVSQKHPYVQPTDIIMPAQIESDLSTVHMKYFQSRGMFN
jgi:hypothetical protein